MKSKNFVFILTLIMVLLCCLSAVSASENVDDIIAVSDDAAMDEMISEVDFGDESISASNEEQVIGVGNSSALIAQENNDIKLASSVDDDSALIAQNDDELSGDSLLGESNDIYVDPVNGNDNNDGSESTPVKSLKNALNIVNAGGTIIIKEGTYSIPFSEQEFVIGKSVSINGTNREKTIITFQGFTNRIITRNGNDGVVTFSNLTIKNTNGAVGVGLVIEQGSCNLINVTIDSLKVLGVSTGSSNMFNFINSSFIKCTGITFAGSGAYTANINSCIFNGMSNVISNTGKKPISVNYCTFISCTNIVQAANNANVTFNNSYFTKNDNPSSITNVEMDNWIVMTFENTTKIKENGDVSFLVSLTKLAHADGTYTDLEHPELLPLASYDVTYTLVNGTEVTRTLVNLKDEPTFEMTGPGNISASAAGQKLTINIPEDIDPIDTNLSADDLEMTYNDGSAWNVTLTDINGNSISGATIKFRINGKDTVYSYVTDENGVASLPINLGVGIYAVNATFEGDNTYKSSFVNATVTVLMDYNTIYVDPVNGNDNNDGNISSPVKTLAKAYNLVNDGGTIFLNEGTYTDMFIINYAPPRYPDGAKKSASFVGASRENTILTEVIFIAAGANINIDFSNLTVGSQFNLQGYKYKNTNYIINSTWTNITFENIKRSDCALNYLGHGNIINCSFNDRTIRCSGGDLNITSCTFTNCRNGVFSNSNQVSFDYCSFINCTNIAKAGATFNNSYFAMNENPSSITNVDMDNWVYMTFENTTELKEDGNVSFIVSLTKLAHADGTFTDFEHPELLPLPSYDVTYTLVNGSEVTRPLVNLKDEVTLEITGSGYIQATAAAGQTLKIKIGNDIDANITVNSDPVWTGSNGIVTVNVINATGTVTIEINGKSYTVDLVDGIATKEIPAEYLFVGENNITATYEGPEFRTTNATGSIFVADGVITNSTYKYYFDASGNFASIVPSEVTLDFQGQFIGRYPVHISKPVNVVTTTNDAYLDLNGASFTISNGGSGSNVTGIKFHNAQLYIVNTHHVVLDNISSIVEDKEMGSGIGVTSVRENCTYVTVKNSYFFTKDNGGHSTLVIAFADYCTFDNNTVIVEGNVGNMIYLTTFNVAIPSGVAANVHNNITNNRIYSSNGPSVICWALVVSGNNNLIENNTIEYEGVGITTQYGSTASPNNIYRNNKVLNGGSMSVLPQSIVCNNTVSGGFTMDTDCIAYNNTFMGTVNIKGANEVFENNTIGGAVTINGNGVTFTGNNVSATVTVNSDDNVIKANNITTTSNYAVDLKTKTGNNVTDNYLIASVLKGDSAVNSASETNIVENNYPVTSDLAITVEDITYSEDATVNIEFNPKATGTIVVSIDGTEYTVNITSEGQGSAIIPGLAPKDYEVIATFTPNSIYSLESEANASFTVFKANVTMEVATDPVKVGDDVIVNVTFDKNNVTGDVSITIDGTDYTGAVEDGAATIVIPGLSAGEYDVDVVYTGDDNFNGANTTVSFSVDKYTVDFTKAKGHPGRVDKNATVDVILSESDATGTVSINIDGVDYSAELVDGKAVIYAPLLPAGTYCADVIYSGDSKYENNTAPITFNVNKYYPTMKAIASTVRMDENAVVNVTLPSDATGTVTITVDGVDYTADVVDGTATVELPVISEAGAQSFNVTYSGDYKYRFYTTDVEFNVLKYNADIKATARTVKLGNNVTVNVVLPSDATGDVTITINDTVYTGTVEDGAVAIAIPDLGIGSYALPVKYSGDGKYKPASTTVTFNVNKQTTSMKATARTVKVGDDVTVNVALASDATGEVSIDVNGTVYTAEVADGAASIVIPDLPYGQYAFDVVYSGDDKYKTRTTKVTFNVNKYATTMKATARTVKVGDDVTVNVALASDATGDVIITIDGVDYNATVVDGVASVVLSNLPAGQYSLEVKYSGDDKYKNQTATVKFNVNKYSVRMKATAKYYADGDYSLVSTTLSEDATGNVTVEVDGKSYTANVVDGRALIAIPKLAAGNYTVDVKYSGDAKYKEYSVEKTLNVDK